MVFQQSGMTMIISKKTCQRVNSIVEAALSRLPAGKFQNFYEKHNLVRISSLIDYSLQAQYYPDGAIILDHMPLAEAVFRRKEGILQRQCPSPEALLELKALDSEFYP